MFRIDDFQRLKYFPLQNVINFYFNITLNGRKKKTNPQKKEVLFVLYVLCEL